MTDFDGDGNVIVPTGILNEQAGRDQANVDAQIAKFQAAQSEPADTPWEQDANRTDLGNIKFSRIDALHMAIPQGYAEATETTLARAGAFLDWLNT